MFVSMSRAKQFETLIASKPSIFIEGLNLVPEEIPASDFLEGSASDQIIPMPEIGEYTTRRVKMHENMNLLLTQVDRLVREIPIFELENRPEPDAARLSHDTMLRAAREAGL